MNPRRILATALLAIGLSGLPAAAQQTGLTVDTWTGLSSGKSILILREEGISDRAPDSISTVGEAKVTGLATGTGVRLRGTLTPLVDDNYTFWVNGASNVALWLSEDGSRFDKELIALNLEPTTQTEWAKHPEQRSQPIFLEAGQSYHIEAHVMSGVANGHLAIAWQGQKGSWALAANGATASQSTTQWNADASRANNGNTSGVWSKGEPTLTANQQNSWWKVDFAETRPVNQIVLHNNSQNQNRLSNFRISLLDESGATVTSEDFFTTSGHVGNSFAWDLPAVVQVASVKIQLLGLNLAGNGHLSLAEVQAFHNPPPPENHALASNGASATQSTTSGAAAASLAIDGDDQTATLTDDQTDSWLEIDLGQDRAVNRVVLHNNPQNPSRLSNFRISLLDATDTLLASDDFFTTTGHAGAVHYWNLLTTHQARKIRIELLGNNLDGNGHLSLTGIEALEIDPLRESRDFQIIPGAYLNTIATDPNDLNDNYLPDDFEQSSGLAASSHPEALLQHGDPDGDGISNYDEYRFGGDPLASETWGDGLTRSIWTEFNATGIAAMIANRARFHSYPNHTAHVPNIDGQIHRKNYGVRYRGKFVAPTSGTYRFWIAGNGDAQLWLADGTVRHPDTDVPLTDRFGKQLLATSGHVTPKHDFDYSITQRTRAVQLTAGQAYYIEVLHKQAQGNIDHVSVAWQVPGQSRVIMPTGAFRALAPHPNDLDDDNLPDDWEIAVGLDPTDNGLISAAQGEYGDPDGDGLTNLQEFQFGTNPFSADTDGDGLSDFDEIFFYGTDPTVSNNLDPVVITLPAIHQYSAATGGWSADANGSLVSWERRGGITYTFTVTEPGIHEVTVVAGAISLQPWFTKHLNLALSLGEEAPFATGTISSQHGHSGTLRRLTPWLGAGTHSLTIHHENVLTELRLRLDSVSIKRLGGQDLNEDGVPDWVTANEAPLNKLTRLSTESRTSPASIEGITRRLATAAVEGASGSFPLTASINNTFFTDIPLDEEEPVTLTATFLDGIISETHHITWIPTNLLEFDQGELHIRQNDALRLTAHPVEGASGSFILNVEGASGSFTTEPASSNTPHTLTFDTPGTHTLTATWTPEEGPDQTATVTLIVHTADFGPDHLVRINQARTWTLAGVAASAHVDSDDKLIMGETSGPSGPRTFSVTTGHAADHHVIARIPETVEGAPAAILARGTVRGFSTAQVEQTRDAQIVHRYDDGTWLMQHTVVAVNLPPGVVIRITMLSPGTTFADGSTVLELRAGDFDQNGIAHIYYEYLGEDSPKICHKVDILIEP